MRAINISLETAEAVELQRIIFEEVDRVKQAKDPLICAGTSPAFLKLYDDKIAFLMSIASKFKD